MNSGKGLAFSSLNSLEALSVGSRVMRLMIAPHFLRPHAIRLDSSPNPPFHDLYGRPAEDVALYEYLYGHAYVGSDVRERKRFIEELGTVVWLGQKIVLRALDLDVGPSKVSLRIPLSDLLIATTALEA